MARPTLNTNPKYLALLRRMARQGTGRATVRGLLEELWDSAHECGTPEFRNAEQVEAAAKWEGEPGTLAAELIDLKFIDVLENGNLEIHDYWVHAPDYVRKRAAREAERIAKGKTLQQLRAEAGRKGAQEKWAEPETGHGKRMANGGQNMANVHTRAPAPTLNTYMPDSETEMANGSRLPSEALRATEKPYSTPGSPRGDREPDRPAGVEPEAAIVLEIYQAYPRHEARKRAVEAIGRALLRHDAAKILAATRAYAAQARNLKREYIPYPARWFDEERYLDHDLPQAAQDDASDAIQAAIDEGNALLAQGRSYGDTLSHLNTKYGDVTAFRAARAAGWKRGSYPGRRQHHDEPGNQTNTGTRQDTDPHTERALEARAGDSHQPCPVAMAGHQASPDEELDDHQAPALVAG